LKFHGKIAGDIREKGSKKQEREKEKGKGTETRPKKK
jgi:hypothetical protein